MIVAKTKYSENPIKKTDLFCPGCGKQKVYMETGDGDVYAGPSCYCMHCKFSFSWNGGSVDKDLVFEILND